MSANPWLDDFAVDAHAAFMDAGMACLGIYTPPAGSPVERRAFVDTGLQTQSEYGQIVGSRTVIGLLLADGAIVTGATFVVGAKSYVLDRIDAGDLDDGVLQQWVVRNG